MALVAGASRGIEAATAFPPDAAKQAIAEMTPQRRVAQPRDIAGAILMLASDYAGFVTGSSTPVAGGRLML